MAHCDVQLSKQEILRTLCLTQDPWMCHMHKAGWEGKGMWHDGGQDDALWNKKLIGKVLAEEFAIFGIKLSFLTNISETVCHQLLKLKGRKFILHPYACDLAVGFWVGSKGRKTVQFDFTVGGFKVVRNKKIENFNSW